MLTHPADAPRSARVQRFYDTLQHFKTRTLLERIHDPRGDAAPLTAPLARAVTLSQLQHEILAPGELLLDLFVGPGESYLFAISPDSCRMVPLPGSNARLAERFALYTDVLSSPSRSTREAYPPERLAEMQESLGRLVLDPVADLVAAAGRIVVAPDGVFASIPFATLMLDGGAMLVDRADIVEVPSASVLAWAREPRAATPAATLLAVDGGQGSDLEGARREIRSLQERYAGVEVIAAGDGLLDTLVRAARPGRILHVAAHARVNDDSPWQSGFVLAADTATVPRMLRAWEIAHAHLPYAMGVLAGCETAGGRATNGEGVLGLTSAFLSAGVPVVVSSRWPIDDRATAVLMNHFYDRLAAGESVATALREAQLAVRANPHTRHPFYWAGFSVVGDGGRVIAPSLARNGHGVWLTAVAGAFVAIGIAGWSWRRRRAAPAARA